MESEFITTPTADGLRVTMKSTIELSKYLLHSGFRYVLSNKMNQDRLEVILLNKHFLTLFLFQQFFGMVR